MSLIEWGLSKLKPEVVVPALWRAAASLVGISTLMCIVLQRSIQPYPSTPTGSLAALANRLRLTSIVHRLTQAGQWLATQPHHGIVWLLALVALSSGLYWSARYRVSPVENLHVSLTWIGLAVLRELGCAAWEMLLIAGVVAIATAMLHTTRFKTRYHRFSDRLSYILIHAGGSLLDLIALVCFALIRGPVALGWQWFIINPRAEFWLHEDDGGNNDRIARVQPRESTFVMFAPPAEMASQIRKNRLWTQSEAWRALKRSAEVDRGGGTEGSGSDSVER